MPDSPDEVEVKLTLWDEPIKVHPHEIPGLRGQRLIEDKPADAGEATPRPKRTTTPPDTGSKEN